jgi:hypothetical protein
MLRQYLVKVKEWLLPREGEIFMVIVIVLVALIGFGLGRISALRENKFPIQIDYEEAKSLDPPQGEIGGRTSDFEQTANLLVGSKNSSVYHFPWCSGAQRISESNKIWFSSKEEAEKAGYRPAANCKGL